jgi:hypothetical protein
MSATNRYEVIAAAAVKKFREMIQDYEDVSIKATLRNPLTPPNYRCKI